MEKVYLNRISDDGVQTLGEMLYNGNVIAKTLELPWKDNKNRISCVPKGVYNVVRRNSPKHGNHFHLTNVPGRNLILIHSANYVTQLLGCIGVGANHIDINKDRRKDITESKKTMEKLLKELPLTFEFIIN